jgi:hypothetical protein
VVSPDIWAAGILSPEKILHNIQITCYIYKKSTQECTNEMLCHVTIIFLKEVTNIPEKELYIRLKSSISALGPR